MEKRINEIVNRLNKTKEERQVDLMQEKIQREKLDRKAIRAQEQAAVRTDNLKSSCPSEEIFI